MSLLDMEEQVREFEDDLLCSVVDEEDEEDDGGDEFFDPDTLLHSFFALSRDDGDEDDDDLDENDEDNEEEEDEEEDDEIVEMPDVEVEEVPEPDPLDPVQTAEVTPVASTGNEFPKITCPLVTTPVVKATRDTVVRDGGGPVDDVGKGECPTPDRHADEDGDTREMSTGTSEKRPFLQGKKIGLLTGLLMGLMTLESMGMFATTGRLWEMVGIKKPPLGDGSDGYKVYTDYVLSQANWMAAKQKYATVNEKVDKNDPIAMLTAMEEFRDAHNTFIAARNHFIREVKLRTDGGDRALIVASATTLHMPSNEEIAKELPKPDPKKDGGGTASKVEAVAKKN